MPKICYDPQRLNPDTRKVIDQANTILEEYAEAGYAITLRTLYYQFVARDILPNNEKSYKRLGDIVGKGRLAGLIDWNHLEDRTRYLAELSHWGGVQDALDSLPGQFRIDMWKNQAWRPEVWIEKDAVAGIVAGVCHELDIPYFSCRGYVSLSEMWRASMRLRANIAGGYTPYIIHFGDHDPSGIDMSRDIVDRLNKTFMADCSFKRVALNMDQIELYKPPPNPAKITDPRAQAYLDEYGDESWELDALNPRKFREIIEGEVIPLRDEKQWKADLKDSEKMVQQLSEVAKNWDKALTKKKVVKKAAKKATKKRKA